MPRSDPSRARRRTPDAASRADGGGAAAPIEEHLDAVYAYARRRLPHADAEDVAQACFLALFKAKAEGRAPEDDGAYLLGTARRRVADRFRRQHRRPAPVSLPAGFEAFGDAPLPEELLADEELRALVHTALGFLPSPARALLEARYRGGATTAELAERLGTTPKAVENRLRRARAAFLEHFHAIAADWTDEDAGDGDAGDGDAGDGTAAEGDA